MQRDAILALEGRELDAMVAEVVFGWQWWTDGANCVLYSPKEQREWAEDLLEHMSPGRMGVPSLPCFRAAWTSTWEGVGLIVDELKRRNCDELDINYCLSSPEQERWSAALWGPGGDAIAYGETAPLAVARAALLALAEEE